MRWQSVDLADVAEIFNGKTPSKAEQRGAGHPVLKIKDINDLGEFRGTFESFVDSGMASAFATKHIQHGDTLILNAAHSADYVGSKTYRVEDRVSGALATGEWLIVRPIQAKLDPAFLHHWLNSAETKLSIRRLVRGIHLYPGDFGRLRIYLPLVPEQRRIADILDKADALRVKRRDVFAQLDTLTQSIFLDMFGEAHIPTAAYDRLDNHLAFVTSGGRGWASFYSSTGSRFIRSLDVQMNSLSEENAVFVRPPNNAEAHRTRAKGGDILLTITGSRIGRVTSLPSHLDGSYISQHVAILRIDQDRIEPKFLSYFLSLDGGGQKQIAKAQYGQTKPGLNFEQIRQFEIPLPPIGRQREFVRRLLTAEKLKQKQHVSSTNLDALFSSLQHRAFRGEL